MLPLAGVKVVEFCQVLAGPYCGMLLADMAERFHLLKYGLALVLIYIGGKMLAMPWFHMPVQWSLSIVGTIILISVVLSLKFSGHRPPRSAS